MGKGENAARQPQTLNKTRVRLERQITRNGVMTLRCPDCGTLLQIRPGQQQGLCFGCGRAVDLPRAKRDALSRTARSGVDGFEQLLSLAEEQLSLSSYAVALETYLLCCAIDPASGEAWRGLLFAETEEFRKIGPPPTELYTLALRLLPHSAAAKLRRQWNAYAEYVRQKERLRSERRRRRERSAQQQPGQEGSENAERTPARTLVRALILTACVAGAVCLLFTGTGFLMIMGAAMLSTLGRRRDR